MTWKHSKEKHRPKFGFDYRIFNNYAIKIYEWIIKILQKHKLNLEQLVAFCGDNVNANFGGAEHAGQRNVFHKLKSHRGNLIPVGCPAHVLHNAAKNSADNLPIDIESIIFKLASHFRNSTKRIERFKEICEDFEVYFFFKYFFY